MPRKDAMPNYIVRDEGSVKILSLWQEKTKLKSRLIAWPEGSATKTSYILRKSNMPIPTGERLVAVLPNKFKKILTRSWEGHKTSLLAEFSTFDPKQKALRLIDFINHSIEANKLVLTEENKKTLDKTYKIITLGLKNPSQNESETAFTIAIERLAMQLTSLVPAAHFYPGEN